MNDITQEEYEKALDIVETFQHQCSKCKKRTKDTAYRNSFEIIIDTNAEEPLEAFWGGKVVEHPAVRHFAADPHKIVVYAGINKEYQLCEDCHKELMQLISKFILNKKTEENLHIIIDRNMHGYEAVQGVFKTLDEAMESDVWDQNDEFPDANGDSENFYIYKTNFN